MPATGPNSPLTIPGLDNGTTYRARVRARNDAGWGPYSAYSAPFTPQAAAVPEPPAIAGQGYSLTWRDEFDTLSYSPTLDDSKRWNKMWYSPDHPAGRVWAADSILHIEQHDVDWVPYDNTMGITTRRVTEAGSDAFQEGYFEARMSWTDAYQIWPAFWTMSIKRSFEASQADACLLPEPYRYAAEIDVFEGQGKDYPPNYVGVLHKNTAGHCGVPDEYNDANAWRTAAAALMDPPGQWHTFGALWTPTEVRWYHNDEFTHSHPTYSTTAQPHYIVLSCDRHSEVIGGTAPATMETLVDWVRIWQKP